MVEELTNESAPSEKHLPLYTERFFLFSFFRIFNAVLKSYTKLLFMQVVACAKECAEYRK